MQSKLIIGMLHYLRQYFSLQNRRNFLVATGRQEFAIPVQMDPATVFEHLIGHLSGGFGFRLEMPKHIRGMGDRGRVDYLEGMPENCNPLSQLAFVQRCSPPQHRTDKTQPFPAFERGFDMPSALLPFNTQAGEFGNHG